MTPGKTVPADSQVVPAGQLHKSTVDVVISYLPAILLALKDAMLIEHETGHVDTTKIITDSISAGTSVLGEIPESHIQSVVQIAQAVAPAVNEVLMTPPPGHA